MKILLFILMLIQIISTAIVFIGTLSNSVLIAVVALISGILQITLTLAVITCLDNIENLKAELSLIFSKLHKLEDENNPVQVAYQAQPATYDEQSKKSWKCVKCDTVNKAGTTHCENCNSEFSAAVNPTYDPQPEKMSRFLKEKKKKRKY